LAIVYQELLSGCLPFRGTNARQLLYQHTKEDPDLESLARADRKVVAQALAKDPADRFASCLDFVASLEAIGVTRIRLAKAVKPPAKSLSDTASDRLADTDAVPRIGPV